MKINIEYGMEVSEEMFSAMKEGVGVDTDEEFIGFLKCAVKTQSVTGCKTTNLKITIEHDETPSSRLN